MKFNSYFIYDVLKQNPKAIQCNAMQCRVYTVVYVRKVIFGWSYKGWKMKRKGQGA